MTDETAVIERGGEIVAAVPPRGVEHALRRPEKFAHGGQVVRAELCEHEVAREEFRFVALDGFLQEAALEPPSRRYHPVGHVIPANYPRRILYK